jgi:hypothetical protein
MASIFHKGDKKGRRGWGWFIEFVVSAGVIWIVLSLAARMLPQIALKQISALTNTEIDAGSVDFRFDGSVYIRELVVRPHRSAGYDNSILKAETVRVHFGVGSLIRFRPRLKEIYVDDFVLRAQYDTDTGKWNLSELKIELPQAGKGRLPLIWLENGQIEYSKVVDGHVRVVASSPVSVGFRPAEKIIGAGYSFDISAAGKQNLAKSPFFGNWQPGRIVICGRLTSKDIPGFERPWTAGALDAELAYEPNRSYVLAAKVKDFNCPPSEFRNVFAFDTTTVAKSAPYINALQEFFNRYGPSGTIDINLQASGTFERLNESRITGQVSCKDVNLCDRNFPYTVEHIAGQIDLTEKSARLKNLAGRHGDTVLAVEGWAESSWPYWRYSMQVASDNMALDKDLYNALAPLEQKLWSAFSPTGLTAIRFSRTQTTPLDNRSSLEVRLLNVDANYEGFAYPLKNTSGTLYFPPDSIIFSEVVSQWEGRKITINGKAELGKGEQPKYDFLIKAENVPIDKTLEEALPAAQREIYNQFETSGLFDTTIKVFNPEGKAGTETFTAEVFPKNGTLKARALPIEVNDVNGKIVFKPEEVNIGILSGHYGAGVVALWGQVWPADEQEELGYCLSMRAKKVEMNDELVGSLPGSLGTIVGQLHPGGMVSLTVDVSRNARGRCRADRLIIECLGSTIDCNLLPYPLRDISGKITITGSQIELDDLTARALHKVRGESLQSVMAMTGRVILGQGTGTEKGAGIQEGEVNFSGENVRFKGKTLSSLDTILGYDTKFGQWVSKYFVADFYEGKMTGKLQISKSSDGGVDYLLEASVTGADLKQFLMDTEKEVRPDEHYSTGSISGSLSIVGSIVGNSIRLGRCRLKITDMQVGKLSPLAKLVQVLNLTEPSDYAFDEMTVDAYIQDDKVIFRKIDLSGKSVAFYGSGRLDLKTDNINLTLTARGKRLATASPSFLQSLTEGLGRAVVRVEVRGKADEPQVTTKPLPVIKETLEILGTPQGE